MQSRETPYQVQLKKVANKAFGWPDNPPIPVYLSETERERIATKGGLKGVDRDDEICLAKVLKELALA
jgi:hypothetical protein